MPVNPLNPMVIQSDHTVLLEVDNPQYAEARDALARFAELEKSPEHIHTYRLSPLSLWNAAASGLNAGGIIESLVRFSKYDVPGNIQADVRDFVSRFGRLKLRSGAIGELLLTADDPLLMLEVSRNRKVRPYIREEIDQLTLRVDLALRGHIKKALVDIGFPAEDLAGYVEGAGLADHGAQRVAGWRGRPGRCRHSGPPGRDGGRRRAAVVQARIKAWSQHYGAAVVQTLTLVQFRDQDTLDELRADPLLARYLPPFKPEAKLGLAVVAPEDLAAVTALLVERGVDVRVSGLAD